MNNPLPKQVFLSSKKLSEEHGRLIDSEAFSRAISAAREQYVRRMCDLAPASLDTPNQLQASAMCFQRIQGCNDFIEILYNLATPARKVERPASESLDHKA